MSESVSTYRAAPALIVGLDPGKQTGGTLRAERVRHMVHRDVVCDKYSLGAAPRWRRVWRCCCRRWDLLQHWPNTCKILHL